MQNVNCDSLSYAVLKIFRCIFVLYIPIAFLLPGYWGVLWVSACLLLAFFLPEIQHTILSRKWLGPWDYQLHQQ
ncbi:MAG: hypothetical protein ACFHVJ_07530 [Aestuariibacter sp.]